jgi:hypothetical protein
MVRAGGIRIAPEDTEEIETTDESKNAKQHS